MSETRRTVSVAIDARIPDVGLGGVQQVVQSLAIGFSELQCNDVRRVWIVYKQTQWWKDVLPPKDELIELDLPFNRTVRILSRVSTGAISLLYPVYRTLRPEKSVLDTTLLGFGVDLVHLPFQDGIQTKLPTIYHPHDLQHEHLPNNFNWFQRHHRNSVWRRKAQNARVVLAASNLVKQDLEHYWHIEPSRIHVIPIPPPQRAQGAFNNHAWPSSKRPLITYPAVFWKHKNHESLLSAVSLLAEEGFVVDCVLTGAEGPTYKRCRKLVDELGLNDNIHFLGHVPDVEFDSLIKRSDCIVIPSLFEAASLTVWDAQLSGTAVACSDISIFREQAADSVEYFDPHDPISIASSIRRVLSDDEYRRLLIRKATERIAALSNLRLAEQVRGVYFTALDERTN